MKNYNYYLNMIARIKSEKDFDNFENLIDNALTENYITDNENYNLYNKAVTQLYGIPQIKVKVINQHGKSIDMNNAIQLMDKDICKDMDEIFWCDVDDVDFLQNYFDDYCEIYKNKYGKEWELN